MAAVPGPVDRVDQVPVEAVDVVADRATAGLDPAPQRVRARDRRQAQAQARDRARVKDRGPVRVTGRAMGQGSAPVPRGIIRVTDRATAPAMMEKALRTGQATARVAKGILRVQYNCEPT